MFDWHSSYVYAAVRNEMTWTKRCLLSLSPRSLFEERKRNAHAVVCWSFVPLSANSWSRKTAETDRLPAVTFFTALKSILFSRITSMLIRMYSQCCFASQRKSSYHLSASDLFGRFAFHDQHRSEHVRVSPRNARAMIEFVLSCDERTHDCENERSFDGSLLPPLWRQRRSPNNARSFSHYQRKQGEWIVCSSNYQGPSNHLAMHNSEHRNDHRLQLIE